MIGANGNYGMPDAANMLELWIRSRHGTWRFFQVTRSTLVEIDRKGKRIETGGTTEYLAGVAAREHDGGNLVEEPCGSSKNSVLLISQV